ncbi:MAG: class I SAM-dependent methyltransferase [Sphingomonas sp.]|uniref:SAM-dependent methyltransferase n=1 Tax=Sphingomonas sp. TaxID=28214 RepID=UPI0025CEB085|nr:cyclopropane-fatty-acyl-phospholipid synthase family protein [Sphingomonas sp.]MBX3564576.1 class I SAM-dependent methyltransferase [Sphingomonas sp.]
MDAGAGEVGQGSRAGFFERTLDRIDAGIEAGSIDVTRPDGSRRLLGCRAPGPDAIVKLRSWRALMRLGLSGSSGWYDAWAKGEWASPDPVQVFALFSRNRVALARPARASGPWRLAKRAWHWLHRNSRSGARKNIHAHYDLGNDFYAQWLDPGMTYSSAIFVPRGQSLADAQAAKLAAILDRTATRPGDTILEIGCGWGSFAETALAGGREIHGITISPSQLAYVKARNPHGRFSLTDYRDIAGSYDAVVSIEMAEAVGRHYWPDYLSAIAKALKPGGRAALQIITFDDALFEGYASNVDFIQTYIFPGGLLISESAFRKLAARNGLAWRDQVNFGASYAETCRIWRENFDAAVKAGTLPKQFDGRFIDLWRYYLMYCEGGFRGGGIDVVQVTLIKEG